VSTGKLLLTFLRAVVLSSGSQCQKEWKTKALRLFGSTYLPVDTTSQNLQYFNILKYACCCLRTYRRILLCVYRTAASYDAVIGTALWKWTQAPGTVSYKILPDRINTKASRSMRRAHACCNDNYFFLNCMLIYRVIQKERSVFGRWLVLLFLTTHCSL
jgi:hypothetical protein